MKSKLSLRETAIIKFCWRLETKEKERLDRFFLIEDNPTEFFEDLFADVAIPMLVHENKSWNVHYCNELAVLKKAESLMLSFRENKRSNFNWVLVDVKKGNSHE
jgi:hypothetical protein